MRHMLAALALLPLGIARQLQDAGGCTVVTTPAQFRSQLQAADGSDVALCLAANSEQCATFPLCMAAQPCKGCPWMVHPCFRRFRTQLDHTCRAFRAEGDWDLVIPDGQTVRVDCQDSTFAFSLIADGLSLGSEATLEFRRCTLVGFAFDENPGRTGEASTVLLDSALQLSSDCTVRFPGPLVLPWGCLSFPCTLGEG